MNYFPQTDQTYVSWNGMEHMLLLNLNHGGIFCDVHFAGHLRSNGTNLWSDKRNIQNMQCGGSRGPGLRTAGLVYEYLMLVLGTTLI